MVPLTSLRPIVSLRPPKKEAKKICVASHTTSAYEFVVSSTYRSSSGDFDNQRPLSGDVIACGLQYGWLAVYSKIPYSSNFIAVAIDELTPQGQVCPTLPLGIGVRKHKLGNGVVGMYNHPRHLSHIRTRVNKLTASVNITHVEGFAVSNVSQDLVSWSVKTVVWIA
ncbi:MAG: hypothetical protein CMI60_16165 [Parvibaculum sp.]|nr:hypothetical protein [Parvibaculum sp.]